MQEDKKVYAKVLIEELLAQASDEREDEIIAELEKILPDPEFMDYIFHSDEFEQDDGTFDIEKFIEKCFSYKSIAL
ncbi:hypothetical protein ACQ0P8_05690 [Halodesulfovibrio aestuarii]|uniref:Uncharacterized protein n=1 Tax=Halodesulfovibrio aestuarii TaxID=126333 RepID=A0A8G2C8N1_9BACT|nr:hypothetical protein [Halodesulfovibrio aestuarii]SHI84213.1 hypothetical protein SAMN05660830_01164 [Halodesulfovibrio aestuarii]